MTSAHVRIPCPFGPCTARPEVLPMRGRSLETPAVDLIREHVVDPDSWFGLCPASNQQYPPPARLVELLGEQELTLLTLRAERARAAAQTEHGIEQQPDRPRQGHRTGGSSRRWFQNSEQGDPRQLGPSARPKLTVVPNPAPEPRGGSVASVAETKAAIAKANQSIAEGQAAAQNALQRLADAQRAVSGALEKFTEAAGEIDFVRSNSVDPLGGPQVHTAITELETARILVEQTIESVSAAHGAATPAIEANNAYAGGL